MLLLVNIIYGELIMNKSLLNDRGWQVSKTLEQFGKNTEGTPMLSLQENLDGKIRVVFNTESFGLSFNEFKDAFSELAQHQARRDWKDQFVSIPTFFEENHPTVKEGVFHDFLNIDKIFDQKNVWLPNSPVAMFSTLSKGRAFYKFLEYNIPEATASFSHELGDVAEKINQVIPIKQKFEAPTLIEMQKRIELLTDKKQEPTVSISGPNKSMYK